jgi:undecaprenyl-diphosphatase
VAIARAFTALGEPTVLLAACALCALWLWYARRGRLGITLVLIALIGRGLSEAQKYWIARVRPDVEPHLVVVKTSSFPSGHAASSMIFYLALAIALTAHTRWSRIAAAGAILLSLLIGTSRVMLGVHWPSDVIGGWTFGMLWVLLTLRPAERLLRANYAPAEKQL